MRKHNTASLIGLLFIGLLLGSCKSEPSKFELAVPVTQIQLERIDKMPNMPKPFKIIDLKNLAKDYDSLVFDDTQTGNIGR